MPNSVCNVYIYKSPDESEFNKKEKKIKKERKIHSLPFDMITFFNKRCYGALMYKVGIIPRLSSQYINIKTPC